VLTRSNVWSFRFYRVLDSEKSGSHIKPDVAQADKSYVYRWAKPECLRKDQSAKADDSNSCRANLHSVREAKLPFVLDTLRRFASAKKAEYMHAISSLETTSDMDEDIVRPWTSATDMARTNPSLSQELIEIQQFVEHVYREWAKMFQETRFADIEDFASPLMSIFPPAYTDFTIFPSRSSQFVSER
jgi:hypothetical protein